MTLCLGIACLIPLAEMPLPLYLRNVNCIRGVTKVCLWFVVLDITSVVIDNCLLFGAKQLL